MKNKIAVRIAILTFAVIIALIFNSTQTLSQERRASTSHHFYPYLVNKLSPNLYVFVER